MKITDLALIFIGIILPLIIVVYVNVSFTIKAQEQEIYYKQIIDLAAQDATNQMKEVENEDTNIDYGYSGTETKKISVNAKIAVDTFLNSLYNNFGIKGNEAAERYLQLFIPAIAIIDYDGIQVSSIESYQDNGEEIMAHALKPKRYYTYTYTIAQTSNGMKMFDGIVKTGQDGVIKVDSYHQVDFTMDDYITHRWSDITAGAETEHEVRSFYIEDSENNSELAGLGSATGTSMSVDTVVNRLLEVRKDIIADTVVKELAYATNMNNSYARAAGVTYNFSFPTTTNEELYASIENVGFMAFVQGISVGNRYLNTKAYGITNLELTTRYYFTIASPDTNLSILDATTNLNYYHQNKACPVYQALNTGITEVSPRYVLSKQQASSATVRIKRNGEYKNYQGFYPCPICVP